MLLTCARSQWIESGEVLKKERILSLMSALWSSIIGLSDVPARSVTLSQSLSRDVLMSRLTTPVALAELKVNGLLPGVGSREAPLIEFSAIPVNNRRYRSLGMAIRVVSSPSVTTEPPMTPISRRQAGTMAVPSN